MFTTSSRINDGGWRVVVRALESDNRPDGGGGGVFIQEIIPAVVTIDSGGKVVGYERFTYEQIDKAEQQSRSAR